MLWGNVLLTAAISIRALAPAPPPNQGLTLYRIELSGDQTVWAQDKPRDAGTALLFHRYPGGLLVSIRTADVKRVTPTRLPAAAPRRRGDVVVLGPTGGGPEATPAEAGSAANPLPPGERKDGTALLNPDRRFRPEWDTRQVPGLNLPYPAAPGDYREGKTFAYPPASAVQQAPGDVPKGPPGNGELPRGPSN